MISYTGTTLTISEKLKTNAIAWIHSLPETEMGPTQRILDDLRVLSVAGGLPLTEYPVTNRVELEKVFDVLIAEARNGTHSVLHVDAHGSDVDGIQLAPSGEFIPWAEVIELVRKLNVATNNNLTCVFALCFGLNLYKQLSIKEAVPAYLFIAPPSKISVGFLEDQTRSFYEKISKASDVKTAFEETLGESMELINCQGLFFNSLLKYISFHCMGQSGRERIEQLVIKSLREEGIRNPTRYQLRNTRSKVRKLLKPGQSLVNRFAPTFLIGRDAAFAYADIKKMITHSAVPK